MVETTVEGYPKGFSPRNIRCTKHKPKDTLKICSWTSRPEFEGYVLPSDADILIGLSIWKLYQLDSSEGKLWHADNMKLKKFFNQVFHNGEDQIGRNSLRNAHRYRRNANLNESCANNNGEIKRLIFRNIVEKEKLETLTEFSEVLMQQGIANGRMVRPTLSGLIESLKKLPEYYNYDGRLSLTNMATTANIIYHFGENVINPMHIGLYLYKQ